MQSFSISTVWETKKNWRQTKEERQDGPTIPYQETLARRESEGKFGSLLI